MPGQIVKNFRGVFLVKLYIHYTHMVSFFPFYPLISSLDDILTFFLTIPERIVSEDNG